MNFVRLAQFAFLFATNRLPAGEPEELFAELRETTGTRFQELLDEYVAKARDVVETDAARTVPDADLLSGRGWEHAKRLAAKHEVPVEVVMDATDGNGADESSIFVLIKGDGENRVTSFRVKLNIERPADSGPVAALAADAAMIFLERVQWENSEEVVRLVRSLKEFELESFGSRIRFIETSWEEALDALDEVRAWLDKVARMVELHRGAPAATK